LALCSAYPLSALFHAVTPLGFRLQSLPLTRSDRHLSMSDAPFAVSPPFAWSLLSLRTEVLCSSPRPARGGSTLRVFALGQSVAPGRCYPVPAARSSLDLFLSGVFSPRILGRSSRPAFPPVLPPTLPACLSERPPLMGFGSTLSVLLPCCHDLPAFLRRTCSTEFQRTRELACLFRGLPTP